MEDSRTKIRVLLSAYACEPGKGSEPGVGWNVVRELSSRVNLTVITRPNNRASIEASGESWISVVNWVYWDPPLWLTFWKKGGRGIQLFYILWQMGIHRAAKRLLDLESYDLLHHLTFGKYWVPSSLAKSSLPFIFGPVGGGEYSPPGLRTELSMRGRLAEFSKKLALAFVGSFPPTRRLLQKSAWTFAATPQTEAALVAAGVTRVSVLPQSGICPKDFAALDLPTDRTHSGRLRLVTASRLIHWKAIDLAIEALVAVPRDLDVHLTVLQTGPEKERLIRLAEKLGVADRVEFKGHLPSLEDVYREIATADALVHPALHEAFGQSCLEALALGTPVICLDWAGPGMIVDESCGYKVTPHTREETIQAFAFSIISLFEDKSKGISRRSDCIQRATSQFQWNHLVDQIAESYFAVLSRQYDKY